MKITSASENDQHAMILPCSKSDFTNFVSSLLGKPEAIRGNAEGPFNINQGDITSLMMAIDQRIKQQNDGELVMSEIQVVYSDNTSVTHQSLDGFTSYNEIRNIFSASVFLRLVYLITFRDKTAPEKQEIHIEFSAGHCINRGKEKTIWIGINNITYAIFHTARTWGADIEGLLSGLVQKFIDLDNDFYGRIDSQKETIGFSVGLVYFLISFYVSYGISNQISAKSIDLFNKIVSTSSKSELLGKKLDFLAEQISLGTWEKFYFWNVIFLVVSAIVASFLGAWISKSLKFERRSFILLNKESEKEKEKFEKAQKGDLRRSAIPLLVSVLSGIISNFLFYKIYG